MPPDPEREALERLDAVADLVAGELRPGLDAASRALERAREDPDGEALDDVADAHGRIESAVEDLFALARPDPDALAVEPVSLADAVDRCLERTAAGVTLVVEADPTVRADAGQLRRLLDRLLQNAAQRGDGDVTVTIGGLDRGFFVADDARSIDPGAVDQAFQVGGLYGIDLAVAGDVAAAHGWSVRVAEGGGARFEITGVEFVE